MNRLGRDGFDGKNRDGFSNRVELKEYCKKRLKTMHFDLLGAIGDAILITPFDGTVIDSIVVIL